MSWFDDASSFFSGVGDELGLTGGTKADENPEQLGKDFASGIKDIFRTGIDSLQDEYYAEPSGDPHMVVEKRSGAPVVSGESAPVESKNINGGGVKSASIATGSNTVVYVVAALVLAFTVLR